MKKLIIALFVLSSTISFGQNADEDAIKKVIDDQKTASDAADFKAYKSHWVQAPYISYQFNGRIVFRGDDFFKDAEAHFANKKPGKIKVTRSDWSFRINGTSAFVIFNQVDENLDKKTIYYTYQERYFEKEKGEWKLVNMTAIAKAK